MWEKIKKFFKWIADHTGISWIARKISSGWKWLFGGKANATQQNTSQQEKSSGNERQEPAQANGQSKDTTAPKTPVPSGPTPTVEPEGLKTPSDDSSVNQSTPLPYEPLKTTTQEPAQPTLDEKSQESVVNKREEGELKLNTALNGIDLSLKQALVVQDYKSHNVNANGSFTELLIYIKCGKDEYRVVGFTLGNLSSIFNVPIESIVKKNENGEYLDSNIKYPVNKDVKEMLGLKDDVTTVKVDSISNKPFGTPTLEQPKSNDNIFNQQSAGPGGLFQSNDKEPQPTTLNQLVNQDNIAGQDSSKIGETQNSPTTDLTTEQSTSSADKEEYFDAVDTKPSPTIGVPATERHYVTNLY